MCTIRTTIVLIPRTRIAQFGLRKTVRKNLTLSADGTRTPLFVSSFVGSCTLLQEYCLFLSLFLCVPIWRVAILLPSLEVCGINSILSLGHYSTCESSAWRSKKFNCLLCCHGYWIFFRNPQRDQTRHNRRIHKQLHHCYWDSISSQKYQWFIFCISVLKKVIILSLYYILHLSSRTWHSVNDRVSRICSMINTLL